MKLCELDLHPGDRISRPGKEISISQYGTLAYTASGLNAVLTVADVKADDWRHIVVGSRLPDQATVLINGQEHLIQGKLAYPKRAVPINPEHFYEIIRT